MKTFIVTWLWLTLVPILTWTLGESTFGEVSTEQDTSSTRKLYWFIPDGMRAEPEVFKVFEWAREGKLPNIKQMMDNGSYGYCMPNFPSHTPVNFATLLTGCYPKTHGVADGPMHIEGHPLSSVSAAGFSSVAKKVPPIWVTLEEQKKNVFVLAIPGSTPPEMTEGVTVRGRWGGWGADFHALNFQAKGDLTERKKQGRATRLFFFGPQLTNYLDAQPAEGWTDAPASFSTPLEAALTGYGTPIHAYFYDATDDGALHYDSVAFSLDKQTVFSTLKQGEWSDWQDISLIWQDKPVASAVKIKVIKLDDADAGLFFRIRCFYNNVNPLITAPPHVADDLTTNVGPMVDFVDNFPAQLIYYPEDKATFLEETELSMAWHEKAAAHVLTTYKPDVFIHDTYTPNQMLSSRWWLGYIDPLSIRYNDVTAEQREQLFSEVLEMYKGLDDILGQYLAHADANTYVVLSSDHGMAALNKSVNLNNLFAKEGLLHFKFDDNTGEPIIDWEKTKVIYLKMDNIYISPTGLAGNWQRSSGPEYESLREQVIRLLYNLTDETGKRPVAVAARWDEVREYLDLPEDRVGDLIVANEPGFGWNEELTKDLAVFSTPLVAGYKQAIIAEDCHSMLTPFVVMGPGVKKNYELRKIIKMVDQYPTLMHLLQAKTPDFVEGRIIYEICE